MTIQYRLITVANLDRYLTIYYGFTITALTCFSTLFKRADFYLKVNELPPHSFTFVIIPLIWAPAALPEPEGAEFRPVSCFLQVDEAF